MSWRAVAWAYEMDLPGITKAILMTLAEHHNDDRNQCNPRVKRIAYKSGFSERTVAAHLLKLKEMGLIRIVNNKRDDGSNSSSDYLLALHQPGATNAPHSAVAAEQEPVIEPVREPGTHNSLSLRSDELCDAPEENPGANMSEFRNHYLQTDSIERIDPHGVSITSPAWVRERIDEHGNPYSEESTQESVTRYTSTGRPIFKDSPQDTEDAPPAALVKKVTKPKRVTVVTGEFTKEMFDEYYERLGGAVNIADEINAAIGHKAYLKWDDKQTYIRRWLDKEVKARQGKGTEPSPIPKDPGPFDYLLKKE